MTLAGWMIGAAALLPYLCTVLAKAGGQGFDNNSPRDWQARLTGWRRRADWAQRNHFEAFPAFAAAVILAQVAGAAQGRVDALAVVFVVTRLAYTAAYLGDWATARSICFALGFGCVVWIFLLPL